MRVMCLALVLLFGCGDDDDASDAAIEASCGASGDPCCSGDCNDRMICCMGAAYGPAGRCQNLCETRRPGL